MSKQVETEIPKENDLDKLDQENEEEAEDLNAENDPEILKKVQNLTIDNNMFKDSNDKSKKHQKTKNKEKNNKKNGVDFLEYAKEHKIDMTIKYEKSPPKKDVQLSDKKTFTKNNNNQTFNNNKGYNKNSNNKYNNNKKYGNNNDQNKLFNNKFDPINGFNNNPYMMYNYPMMRPDLMMFKGGYYNNHGFEGFGDLNNHNQMNYQMNNINQEDHLYGKGIKESLEYYLSIDNLNKDSYLRKQIDDEGYVDVNTILSFNNMKKHNANLSNVKEVLSEKECSLEDKTEGDKLFIRNKNWSKIKSSLLSIDEIEQQKNVKKNYNYNFVTLQNNYFMPMVPMDPNMIQGMGFTGYGNTGYNKQN